MSNPTDVSLMEALDAKCEAVEARLAVERELLRNIADRIGWALDDLDGQPGKARDSLEWCDLALKARLAEIEGRKP